jgi:hypothetical protein
MARIALYRHFDAAGRLLYVGVSADPVRRGYEHACRTPWKAQSVKMEAVWLPSREDALQAEAEAIRTEAPIFNVQRPSVGVLSFCEVDTGPTLRQWLKENGVTQVAFAEHIGITQGVLSRFMAGVSQPSIDTAVAIQRATRGEVLPAVWAKAPVSKCEAA